MLKLLHAVLLGLVGAAIVHIAVLLLIPEFAERDAWSRLASASGLYTATPLHAEPGVTPTVKSVDPLFLAATCRFDLSDGTVQAQASGDIPFWSVSVYNRAGENIYSFNDRTATSGNLDLVVLTPEQMIEVRKILPPEYQKSIFAELPIDEGIVVVRAFVPDNSWQPKVSAFLKGLSCSSR
jgi:uncharacterized membrane protein